MKAAHAYAELSHALRAKVGSVIVRDNRIISIGYNGTPAGRDNNCEVEITIPGQPSSVITGSHLKSPVFRPAVLEKKELVTKSEVCHAEMNAILYAAKHGTSTDGCSVYVTLSPCFECAKMIVQSGIQEVFYETEYRDLSSVDFLRECGVKVTQIKGE